jgi:CRP-like cAMP-binding protein
MPHCLSLVPTFDNSCLLMGNELINYFARLTDLSDDEKTGLLQSMDVQTFKKDSFLLKAGQLNSATWFVLEGLVRQYVIRDGQEISTGFYSKGQWIIAEETKGDGRLADAYLQCIEETVLVFGNEQKAKELFKQFPRFEAISRQVMEKVYFEQREQMTSYITDKAEQRYLRLIETRPEILQKVPQYDIATYIGVKPESLSRIRRKLQQKK